MGNWLNRHALTIMVLGLSGIWVGCLLAWYLPAKRQRAADLARDPQTLTLRELIDNGPGDNPHIVLTNFDCGEPFTIKAETHAARSRGRQPPGPEQSAFRTGWLPLYPKQSEPIAELQRNAPRPPIRVILQTESTLTNREREVVVLTRKRTIEGRVTPLATADLPKEVRDNLTAAYPDTDIHSCFLFEQVEDRKKTLAAEFATIHTVATAGAFSLGCAMTLFGLYRHRLSKRQTAE